jgi:hypothetical protein
VDPVLRAELAKRAEAARRRKAERDTPDLTGRLEDVEAEIQGILSEVDGLQGSVAAAFAAARSDAEREQQKARLRLLRGGA